MLLQRFSRWGRAVGHVGRYRVIVGVFLKYGYEDLARRLPLPKRSLWILPRARREHERIARLTPAGRLRCAFEELGPTFIKFGQLLSTRSQLLPTDYVNELAKLHDHVPPVPFEKIHEVLQNELEHPVNEYFSRIEPAPIGSASIAQVHSATLSNGTRCVIKIQRPGIEKTVRVDTQIMAQLATLLENHVEGWKVNRPTAVVAGFARRIEQELNFTHEAAHVERFAHQFTGDPAIYAPRIYRDISTRRILVMEHVEAIKASDVPALKNAGLDLRLIANRITHLIMKQIFVYGFFHADPHPGNIHILPGNVVCFLDFGQMGFLDRQTRETFAALILGIARKDESAATHALLKLANAELDPPRHGLEADVAEFMHLHFYRPVSELVFAHMVTDLFRLTNNYGLVIPPDLFTMLKALSLMENLVSKLDPGHDFIAQLRPFLNRIHRSQLQPGNILRHLSNFKSNAAAFARELPLEIRRIVAQLRNGQAKIIFRHEGLDPLDNTLERVSNRLSFALVLAALMISSSLIVYAKIPPLWHEIPIIGVVGYLVAGLMGFWLLIAILRHGKM